MHSLKVYMWVYSNIQYIVEYNVGEKESQDVEIFRLN